MAARWLRAAAIEPNEASTAPASARASPTSPALEGSKALRSRQNTIAMPSIPITAPAITRGRIGRPRNSAPMPAFITVISVSASGTKPETSTHVTAPPPQHLVERAQKHALQC